MRTQKRNGLERAFNHGYRAAISGKSIQNCPHEDQHLKFQWTSGWREGRSDHWDGYVGVAGLHRQSS